MSRKNSKIFPKLELEDIENSPKLSRGNSSSNIAQNDISGEDENINLSSNRSRNKRTKNAASEEKSSNNTTSPQTPRSSSTQPSQASLISSPSPRQPRLSKQRSFDQKSANHSNQSTPPLGRAKSAFNDDSVSISSNITAKKTGRKSLCSATNSISTRGGRKRVSFKHPIIDPTPENSISNFSTAELDPSDPDEALLDDLSRRRSKRQGQQDATDTESGCGLGCIIT